MGLLNSESEFRWALLLGLQMSKKPKTLLLLAKIWGEPPPPIRFFFRSTPYVKNMASRLSKGQI